MTPTPSRRPALLVLVGIAASCALHGQSVPGPSGESKSVTVSGSVVNSRDGHPLKRASVAIKPADASSTLASFSDTTDEKGRFLFPNVTLGRYSIQVARDGFLNSDTGWIGQYRFPPTFTLREGQDLTGLTFKLFPAGVVSGRVSFDDAEPSLGAEVVLYRDTWWRGRHVYAIAARANTDDRGEYRMHGLEPGDYLLSASWNKPVLVPGAEEEPHRDAKGRIVPDEAYATTFYPSAQKLVEAVPIQLGYGAEASGIDVFLTTARTVRVSGHVTSGLSGQALASPSLTLRRTGADNTASVTVPASVNLDKRGGFEISGVVPGSYYLTAEADEDGTRLVGRRFLTVGEDNIPDLSLLASSAQKWFGRVFDENDATKDFSRLTVTLDPRDETASPVDAQVREDGEFSFDFMPDAVYDVYVKNLPAGYYLKSVNSGDADLLAGGASAPPGASPQAMRVVLSPAGGRLTGAVVNDDHTAAPGVNVDLIPDPPLGRYQDYQSVYSDEYGNVRLAGIAPGHYVLLAWAGESPCDIYNPNDLPACLAAGASVEIHENEDASVTLKLAAAQ